jgi:hypothetical protein
VKELYDRLVNDGVDAWLDREKLLPGQDWQVEISKAVKTSDIVVVCLSSHSITKEGFVQKEIKYALDIADEKPDGTIFIIPARLENCDVPSRISKFQWVDLFSDDGYDWLLKSLQMRSNSIETKAKYASSDITAKDNELSISKKSLFGNSSKAQSCPICGKYNEITSTFHCKECHKDFICLTHRNSKFLVCLSCAREKILQSHLTSIAQGFESDLVGWITPKQYYPLVTTKECLTCPDDLYRKYVEDILLKGERLSDSAPHSVLYEKRMFVELLISIENIGNETYDIPLCSIEVISKSGERAGVFRKYQASYFVEKVMFEEYDPIVFELNGEDISEKRNQVVTLKGGGFTRLYVAFSVTENYDKDEFLNISEKVIVYATNKFTGERIAVPLLFA